MLKNKIKNQNIFLYIKIFNILYKTKKIKSAANILQLSYGSISKYLLKLEKLVDKKLFIRNGRNGIKTTEFGEMLYSKFNNLENIEDDLKNLFKNQKQIINISMHVLFFKTYFLKFLKKNDYYKDKVQLNISNYSREDAMLLLLENKLDIIFYPIDMLYANRINDEFEFIKIKEYKICLYINKKNFIAKKNIKKISWEDAKQLNIFPVLSKSSMPSYLNVKLLKHQNFLSDIVDLNLIYHGLKENIWATAIGEEIEEHYNMKEFKKKQIYKTNLFGVKAFWCAIYKTKNKNKLIDFINYFKFSKSI